MDGHAQIHTFYSTRSWIKGQRDETTEGCRLASRCHSRWPGCRTCIPEIRPLLAVAFWRIEFIRSASTSAVARACFSSTLPFASEGEGEAWLQDGQDLVPLRPGVTLVLRPNVQHWFRATGRLPLKTYGIHASPHRIVNLHEER